MKEILTADLEVTGWCSFRIPHSINTHLTYPAPPPTTLYGLVANALGMAQDDYSLASKLHFGVRILKDSEVIESYTHWQKWNPSKSSMYSLVMKQKIIQPAFRMYLASDDDELLQQIEQALKDPARLLYLGESDDLVEINSVQHQTVHLTQSTRLHSSIPFHILEENEPVNSGVSMVKWPLQFQQQQRNSFSVQYELVYLGQEIEVKTPIPCWQLADTGEYIILERTDIDE